MTAPLAAPEPAAVYTGRSDNWPMVVATSVGAVAIVAMGATSPGGWGALAVPLALAALGVLVNVATATSVRATAGPSGVTIHWGLVGWPRIRIPFERIERAEIVDVPWWRVSWGYWWTPRRTTCTVQAGPALRLVLVGGRRVTVTVPDPQAAVDAIGRA